MSREHARGSRFHLHDPIDSDGGIAYRTAIPAPAVAPLADERIRAEAAVLENGEPLPRGNVLHADIRITPGCFSVWDQTIYFSSIDGSDPRVNGRSYELWVPGEDALEPRHGEIPLSRPFTSDGGYASVARLPFGAVAALATDPLVAAMAVVLEDGVALAHPGQQHQIVRELGYGRFSTWEGQVHFSSSDGSDCATNDRNYTLQLPQPASAAAMARGLEGYIAADDAALLRLVDASLCTNNTIVNNFLEQCTFALEYLGLHEQARDTVVVLGCGARPWTPLRFVAEGFRRVIANDLCEVEATFDDQVFHSLLDLLHRIAPRMGSRLDAAAETSGDGRIQVAGLEARGGTPFEDLDVVEGSVDLVFSSSVLEHVMDPQKVYSRMESMLSPKGCAIHRIDLRDHLHFFDPLRFLHMSVEEYGAIATENRLRASDHIRLAEEAGLRAEVIGVQALPWPDAQGTTHAASTTATPIVIASGLDEVIPVISDVARTQMAPEFHGHDLRDLSVVGLSFVLHKT